MELTQKQVAQIKGMLLRGDRHMDIATLFGINQARVSEIKLGKRSGKRYADVSPAPPDQLEPPGPYVVVPKATVDELRVKELAHQKLIERLELLLLSIRTEAPDTVDKINAVRG